MRWLIDQETNKKSNKRQKTSSSGPGSSSRASASDEQALQVIDSRFTLNSLLLLTILSTGLHFRLYFL